MNDRTRKLLNKIMDSIEEVYAKDEKSKADNTDFYNEVPLALIHSIVSVVGAGYAAKYYTNKSVKKMLRLLIDDIESVLDYVDANRSEILDVVKAQLSKKDSIDVEVEEKDKILYFTAKEDPSKKH